MRILLLNFAYGIPVDGSRFSYLKNIPHFFYAGRSRCRQLAELVKAAGPDIVGLVEVDGGSMRAGFVPEWRELSDLGYSHFALSKYLPRSIWNKLPILNKHMNGLFTKSGLVSGQEALYLFNGMKRLVLHQTLAGGLEFYLIHLAIDEGVRKTQLAELAEIIVKRKGNRVVVAGDFNSFKGRSELEDFCQSTGLRFANNLSAPTFPAYEPKFELDYLLVSPGMQVKSYEVLSSIISDHRAVLVETIYN